ncbi:DUF5666 domain-containing protein [Vibrio sp. CK2-1]|uniref:DUF5666 domain-containing protein n=1 Tax=Vibrio sp. CK2-1 TaxID=2912249 RepID=UPI001F4416FD|nr:DUF5666 domain-containing protein [Vibrio sp. CK2-1]MCF7353208.1 DUF5666 domain-containing protein [Vibrio sp. CK2-1]
MKKTILCLSVAALLSACGGSDSDSSNSSNTTSTPSQLNGMATQVTDTHVTINDYQLNAQSAEISYDDQAMTMQDIQQGMRIEVETDRSGNAEEIEIDPNLVGIVSAVNADSIVVNGVTISTAGVATTFTKDNWVFANGYFNDAGEWQSEGVFSVTTMHEAEIEGMVSQLTAHSFFIGSTEIDYSTAHVDLDDAHTLANGDWVEIEGYMNDNSGVFVASEVEVENDDQYSDMELEGTITWVNNEQTSIELNGRTQVAITANTDFDDGEQADLIEGARIEADLINGDSGLEATEIEFEDGSGSQTQSSVKFALSGTATLIDDTSFSINGYEFITDSRTQFENSLTMASIDNRDIEIEGVESTDANGTTIYLVKEVEELEANDNDIDLEGSIENGMLWGYSSIDGSLDNNGSRTDVECTLVNLNTDVSNCRVDD